MRIVLGARALRDVYGLFKARCLRETNINNSLGGVKFSYPHQVHLHLADAVEAPGIGTFASTPTLPDVYFCNNPK